MNPETILADNIKKAMNRLRDANGKWRVRLIRNRLGLEKGKGFFGLGTGSPDLVGVLRSGRAFCVEVKLPKTGVVRQSQKSWWIAARKWNVSGGYARTIEEAKAHLLRAECTHKSRSFPCSACAFEKMCNQEIKEWWSRAEDTSK